MSCAHGSVATPVLAAQRSVGSTAQSLTDSSRPLARPQLLRTYRVHLEWRCDSIYHTRAPSSFRSKKGATRNSDRDLHVPSGDVRPALPGPERRPRKWFSSPRRGDPHEQCPRHRGHGRRARTQRRPESGSSTTGGYALLLIDAETGKSEEFPMPFLQAGTAPMPPSCPAPTSSTPTSIAISRITTPSNASSRRVTRPSPDGHGHDQGRFGIIWSVTYPQAGWSPSCKPTAFKDYGHVHAENWAQYQRSVAADDKGWIYFGVGNTASQIMAFDPKTGKATAMIPESERGTGSGSVYRNTDGKVYGQALPGKDWYEFYQGAARRSAATRPVRQAHHHEPPGPFPRPSSRTARPSSGAT